MSYNSTKVKSMKKRKKEQTKNPSSNSFFNDTAALQYKVLSLVLRLQK